MAIGHTHVRSGVPLPSPGTTDCACATIAPASDESYSLRMRVPILLCVLVAVAVAAPAAAERAWKSGTWSTADRGAYAIETSTQVITAESPGSETTVEATPGTGVQFAIDAQTVYVLDAKRAEHTLKLLGIADKYSKSYAAVGSGHYIKAVAPGGTQVTLEDGSRWDIDSRQHFAVATWHPDDLISIRREEEDPQFAFEIDNTTEDDGALANYRVR